MLIVGSGRLIDCFTGHKDGASESDRVCSHHGGGHECRTD